ASRISVRMLRDVDQHHPRLRLRRSLWSLAIFDVRLGNFEVRLGYAAAPLLGQGGVAAPSNKWPRSFERRGRGGLFKHRVFGAMGACGGSWFSEFIIETRRNQNGWNCGILVLQLRQRCGNICNADSSRVKSFDGNIA